MLQRNIEADAQDRRLEAAHGHMQEENAAALAVEVQTSTDARIMLRNQRCAG
jgi:hypothetical protein